MAKVKTDQTQATVDNIGRQQFQKLASERPSHAVSFEEREAACNRRFAQEVSKFDANYFKAMTSTENAPLSTSRLAQPEMMRKEARRLRASLAGTGASRAMWMGMMCLTPMLREGLTMDSVATIGGMMAAMCLGALVTMPDRVAKMRNKHDINKEINQLNKQARAKEYDQWCRKMERKVANGESLFPGISHKRSEKVLETMHNMRDSAAKNAGVRVGLTEESVGIAGVGILVAANKQMREHPDEVAAANRVYQENMATLYYLAQQDGMTKEGVQAAVGRAYARVVDGIIQEEGEDCYNNPDSMIHDFATGNGIKPVEMQHPGVEKGSKEFVVAHKDGCVPYAKDAYTTSEREFVGDMKPFVTPTHEQAVMASGRIITRIGKEFETVESEAKARRCDVSEVRAERFDAFDSYIVDALDGNVNPYTQDANDLAGVLYSYERMDEADKNESELIDAMRDAYVDVCKDNVMKEQEYIDRLQKIMRDFQADVSREAQNCANLDDMLHLGQKAADVSDVLRDGIRPQYTEANPFASTIESLYQLQQEASRAVEINQLSNNTDEGALSADVFVVTSTAAYSVISDLSNVAGFPKSAKEPLIDVCDKVLEREDLPYEGRVAASRFKDELSIEVEAFDARLISARGRMKRAIAASGYTLESNGMFMRIESSVPMLDVLCHVRQDRDGAPLMRDIRLTSPVPDSAVFDRLGVDRVSVEYDGKQESEPRQRPRSRAAANSYENTTGHTAQDEQVSSPEELGLAIIDTEPVEATRESVNAPVETVVEDEGVDKDDNELEV